MDGTHIADGWPAAPDPQTIYAVFLPSGTTFEGACTSYGGYHDEATSAQMTEFSYALMPRCTPQAGTALDSLTSATSHELLEAATDPLPFSAPAWVKLDDEHFIWGRTPGGELGDMCEYVQLADQVLVGNFTVQRTWSNISAAAGHDPCVPVLVTPYVGAAPLLDEDLMVTSHMMTIMTKGITVPVSTSKTIEVDLFSDAKSDDFTVQAYDAAALLGTGQATLSFQWATRRPVTTATSSSSWSRGPGWREAAAARWSSSPPSAARSPRPGGDTSPSNRRARYSRSGSWAATDPVGRCAP